MKKAIFSSATLVALTLLTAPAQGAYTVLLAGGAESNTIYLSVTEDGRDYVIDSIHPLEVGGSVCASPAGNPNELICPAPRIAGFEFNADGGDDRIKVSRRVFAPVTMRGGPGDDVLLGGSGPDKLIGGAGNDKLGGFAGDDLIAGGSGDDVHVGGPGDDRIVTGEGTDVVHPGGGVDVVRR